MSGWTFATWTSGTDIITVTGSTGDETIVGSSLIDRFVVSDTNQVSAADRYNGAGGNDILQVGLAGAGTAIDLSVAASDGVNGFLSIEAISFVNTSGTSTATFDAAQFGTGKIAATAAITGVATSAQALVVNMATAGALNMSGWTFATWTAGTDTITVNGSGGADTITGPIQGATILAGAGNDTLIVSASTQVQVERPLRRRRRQRHAADRHGRRRRRRQPDDRRERRRRRLRQHRGHLLRQHVDHVDGDLQRQPVRRRQDLDRRDDHRNGGGHSGTGGQPRRGQFARPVGSHLRPPGCPAPTRSA